MEAIEELRAVMIHARQFFGSRSEPLHRMEATGEIRAAMIQLPTSPRLAPPIIPPRRSAVHPIPVGRNCRDQRT